MPGDGQIRDGGYLRFEGRGMDGGLLVVGSSYAWHGPQPKLLGWTGDWGMAASAREKDVAHLLWSELRKRKPAAPLCIAQSAHWERNYTGDVELLERDFAGIRKLHPEWICFVTTVGNAPRDLTSRQPVAEHYIRMVEWFRRLNPSAKVVISTTCAIPGLREGLEKWAKERSIPVVDHDFLDDRSTGYRAYGKFKHPGVAWHPSDAGFAEMARRYAKALSADCGTLKRMAN